MNIVINDPGDVNMGSTRIFVHYLSDYFKSLGIKVVVNDWVNYDLYDIAIFGKSVSLKYLKEAKNSNRHLVIGIIHPSDRRRSHINRIKVSDFAIVGSVEERDYYMNIISNVFQFPQIEGINRQPKRHTQKNTILLGYHGNKMHLDSMSDDLSNAIDRIGREFDIELKCVYNFKQLGKWRSQLNNVRVRHVQWQLDSWLEELAECDVGLAPGLTKFEGWSMKIAHLLTGKYGFANDYLLRFKNTSNAGRTFVFHQLGIPVVAEIVPSNFHILANPNNGFLAYSEGGWYQALHKLCSSAELRQQIARNALSEFNRQYDPLIWARCLVDDLQSLCRKKDMV